MWQRELTEVPEVRLPLWANRWELAALVASWLLGVVALGITVMVAIG